jgi:predicted metal-binding protein
LKDEVTMSKDGSIQVKNVCLVRSNHVTRALTQDALEEIDLVAKESGFREVHLLKTSEIVIARWVGLKCRYGCANYNTTWCCPPAAPDLPTMRELLSEYEVALLLVSDGNHEHFYRNNAAKRRQQIQRWKSTVALERKLFLMGYYKAFGLPAETCALCKECGYPKQCKFPNEKRPSIEACSIDVFQTLKNLGQSAGLARRVEDSYSSYSLILLI